VICSNCGTEIYQRRRFGGSTIAWVHGDRSGREPLSLKVQLCPGAEPVPDAAVTRSEPWELPVTFDDSSR
jgi:hypothetical protein